MFTFIKNLFKSNKLDYKALMERKAMIIDVRTLKEFNGGHSDHTVNIPLSDIANHIEEIKMQNKPVIVCCRSGVRSGRAAMLLKKSGIEAYNGGAWQAVQTALVE